MKGRITLAALKTLPKTLAGQKRTFLWDDVVGKFGAYRTSSGQVVFVYQFRMHASQPTERLTIGKLGALTPDQARSLAATAALKVAAGINPIEHRRAALQKQQMDETLRLKNFAQHYLCVEVDRKKLRTAKEIRRVIEQDICAHLGDLSIADITVPRVEALLATLSQRSPTAPRAALVQLKAVLNYAKRSNRIERVHIEMMRPIIPPERERELSIRELRRFLEAAHDLGGPRGDAYLCITLLLKRVNEVAEMEWKEIDQDKWLWRLPGRRTKNKQQQESSSHRAYSPSSRNNSPSRTYVKASSLPSMACVP